MTVFRRKPRRMKRMGHMSGIMAATVAEQAKAERAYLGNFWAELASTGLYVITWLVFVELLFARAGTLAGYSKNDFLFMTLIGQLGFYIVSGVLASAMALLIESVRSGHFDLLLLKPVAIRSYLYARALRPLSLAMISLPNLVLMTLVINWSDIEVSLLSVLAGAVVWIAGLIIFNTLLFALALPVFTQGDATDMLQVYYSTMAITNVPFGKLPGVMKLLSFVVLPGVLLTAGTTAALLMKDNAWQVVLPAVFAAAVSLVVFERLWRYALGNYTSASS